MGNLPLLKVWTLIQERNVSQKFRYHVGSIESTDFGSFDFMTNRAQGTVSQYSVVSKVGDSILCVDGDIAEQIV